MSSTKLPKNYNALKRKSFFRKLASHKKAIAILVCIVVFAGIGTAKMLFTNAFVPNLTGNQGELTVLAPSRIFDQRVNENSTTNVLVAGKGGVPATGVVGAVLNITIDAPSAPSYLTVYPYNTPKPATSTINFVPATGALANQISVGISSDGYVSIFNRFGDVRVIVDVSGYYSAKTGRSGDRYTAVTPTTVFNGDIGENKQVPIQISGRGGVPAQDVSAVVVQVNVPKSTALSFLSAYPDDQPSQDTSIVNMGIGVYQASSELIVRLGPTGKMMLFNRFGTASVQVEVTGYFSANGARFSAISPQRIIDTSFKANELKKVKIAGADGIPPSHVRAVSANFTLATSGGSGLATVYASDSAKPPLSTIRFDALSGAQANQIELPVGADGTVLIRNGPTPLRIILDVSGYYVNNDAIEVIDYDASAVMPPNPTISIKKVKDDVIYGASLSQSFDMYTSTNAALNASNQDTLVWFFGGGWENGDNNLTTGYDLIAKYLCSKYGMKLVSVQYRKSGEAPYPAQYQDGIHVVKYLKLHAAELGINPNRLVIGGFSAGADIAATVGYGGDAPELQPDALPAALAAQSPSVRRILAFATPFDKLAWSKNYFSTGNPIRALNKLVGSTQSAQPLYDAYSKINTLNYVDSKDPPMYAVMSKTDEVIPFATQYPSLEAAGKISTVVFQYGGPSGHVAGLDANVAAMIDFLQ